MKKNVFFTAQADPGEHVADEAHAVVGLQVDRRGAALPAGGHGAPEGLAAPLDRANDIRLVLGWLAGWLAGKPDYPQKLEVLEAYEKIDENRNI